MDNFTHAILHLYNPDAVKCRDCHELVPSWDAYKTKDQLRYRCRQCNTARVFTWVDNNRDYANKFQRDWRARNPEKAKVSRVRFEQRWPDRVKASRDRLMARYHSDPEYRERILQQMREYSKKRRKK